MANPIDEIIEPSDGQTKKKKKKALPDNPFVQSTFLPPSSLQDSIEPDVSFFEGAWETMKQATSRTSYGNAGRIIDAKALGAAGPKLTAEQLNELYPDATHKADENMSEALFLQRNREAEEDLNHQQLMDMAPQGWLDKGGYLGAELLVHMADPGALAADIVAGGILNRVIQGSTRAIQLFGHSAQTAALRSRYAAKVLDGALGQSPELRVKALTLALKGQGTGRQQLGRSVLEGAVGNAAIEPLDFAAQELLGKEYTIADFATNVLIGAGTFPLIKHGVKFGYIHGRKTVLKYGDKTLNTIGKLQPSVAEKLRNTALGQSLHDKKIKLDKQIEDVYFETGGQYKGAENKYDPFLNEDVGGRTVYMPVVENVDGPEGATFYQGYAGKDNGSNGKWGSSALGPPNGRTASKYKKGDGGAILEYKWKEGKKVFNMDNKAPEDFIAKVNEEFGTNFKENTTGREILDLIREASDRIDKDTDMLDRFNDLVRERGYSGYVDNGGSIDGLKHPHHNSFTILDDDAIEFVQKLDSHKDSVPRPSQEVLDGAKRDALDNTNNTFDDPDIRQKMQKIDELEDGVFKDEDIMKALKEEEDLLSEAIEELDPNSRLDQDFKGRLDDIKKSAEIDDKKGLAQNMATICILDNGGSGE